MPIWIYAIIGVALVSVIGGGYLFVNNMIAKKDKQITVLQQDIAGKILDINNLKISNDSLQKTLEVQGKLLAASQAQAERIKKNDAAERAKQSEFDKKVQGITSQDSIGLDRINRYQACIASDVTNPKCADIFQ